MARKIESLVCSTMHVPFCSWRVARPVFSLAVLAALSVLSIGCLEDPESEPASGGDQNVDASGYRLTRDGKAVLGAGIGRVPVDPKLATGYVDAAARTGDFVDLGGWAAPTDLSGPAEVIVAVVDGKVVAATKPSVKRRDLVEGYDRPGLERAGFLLSVPSSVLDCGAQQQGMQVFGVTPAAAVELKRMPGLDQKAADACRES